VALYNQHAFCPIPGGDVSATTTGPVGAFFCDDTRTCRRQARSRSRG
jgi:hypothetical protein